MGDEPFRPERREGDHQMKAGVDAPEPALEQGGEGSGVASGSGVAGFFSRAAKLTGACVEGVVL